MEETLFLSLDEAKLLKKSKSDLERRLNVEILMPDVEHNDPCAIGVNLVTISGGKVDIIKKFLKKKMKKLKRDRLRRVSIHNQIPTITLSDSDSNDIASDEKQDAQSKSCSVNETVSIESCPAKKETELLNESCPVKREISLTIPDDTQTVPKKPRVDSSPEHDFIPLRNERRSFTCDNMNDSVVILDPDVDVLKGKSQSHQDKKVEVIDCTRADDSVIILEPDPVEVIPEKEVVHSKVIDPKFLRPVIIDGSNVARAHGQLEKTFSCQGIKIAIDYFRNRGHTQVTAFVPNYRRHRKFGPFRTTGIDILEELAENQLVVFTPSRTVNGRNYTCYDDRFVVELASRTGGVILSNDNYRDLIGESPEFKKTIEERLLMFCFAGDNFMVPNDPLGRAGPLLDDYLSFPQPASMELHK